MQDKDVKFSAEGEGLKHSGEGQGLEVDINTDENQAGSTHLNDIIGDESEFTRLGEELQAQKDKYLRLVAEFDNFRKRNAKERLDLIQTAGREVIVSLLDVLDDCDRAEKQLNASKESKESRAGVLLVFNKLRSILQARGVKAMDALGTEFDTEKHEAITEIPAPSPELTGKVIEEITKGYYLNDKIIRFAKVIVGK